MSPGHIIGAGWPDCLESKYKVFGGKACGIEITLLVFLS